MEPNQKDESKDTSITKKNKKNDRNISWPP